MRSSNIAYISTDTVLPFTPTEAIDPINLTPWDLISLALRYVQMGLLFRKPETKEEESSVISNLKTSFSRTLDYFLPLTCRLATKTYEKDNTVSFYIDGKVVGAEFTHATADVKIADVIDPLSVPAVVRSFFPLNGVTNYEAHTKPLLAVQVTELVDGIFLGCSISHVIGDGKSFWYFINSWSKISKSLDYIPPLPIFKRRFLDETDCPIHFPATLPDRIPEKYSPPEFNLRVFHFSQQTLLQIKLKANKEQETDQISTLQALMGHVWINVVRAKCVDPNQEVSSYMVVDNRTKLNPPLPEEYFGNSLQAVSATAKAGELLERGLGSAAWLFNQAVRNHTNAEVQAFWKTLVAKPFVMFPSYINLSSLGTGSSPRFDMYGNDFGWGRPIAVRSGPAMQLFENIMVHPGAVEGSMDIEVCLAPQTLKAMEEYSEFTKVVAA